MFIQVNDVTIYYEKSGQGEPIILLHGNSESHKIFDVLTKQLSGRYTVYALDSRDHGKSSRVKQLNYADMAEDVACFIRELKLEGAVLYGFSDGGIIGLLLASRYPDLLSKLIISGANLRPEGVKKGFLLLIRIIYLFTRSRKLKMILTQPDIKDEELAKIKIPTLVMSGSKDLVYEAHTRHIAEQIPDSTLKLVKGEGHTSYVVHSEKLYGLIRPFLEDIRYIRANV